LFSAALAICCPCPRAEVKKDMAVEPAGFACIEYLASVWQRQSVSSFCGITRVLEVLYTGIRNAELMTVFVGALFVFLTFIIVHVFHHHCEAL